MSKNLHRYLWANYNQFAGDVEQSQKYYFKIFADNGPNHVYKGYLNFLFQTQQFQRIVSLLPKLEKPFENDKDAQFIFAQALQMTNQQEKADDKLIRLNNKFKDHQEIAFQTAQVYIRRKEPENALETIDNLLNSTPYKPNNFIFYFLKSQIHQQSDNMELALENVKKSIDMYPHFDKSWLLLALLEEQKGRLSEAIKGFTNFLENTDEPNPQIEQHLLQLVFKQKMTPQKNTLVMNKSCMEQALLLMEQKNYKQALDKVDVCLSEDPGNDENKLLKVQILAAMNNHKQALTLVKKYLDKEPSKRLWYKTLHLLTKAGADHQQAQKILQAIVDHYPNNVLPTLYLADMHIKHDNYNACLALLKKALRLTSDKKLHNKITFQIAAIYHDHKQFSALKKLVDTIKKLPTNYPPLDNFLACYTIKNNNNMDLAQKLVTNALKKNTNNPHFLDTQAYIHLKKRDYTKACVALEQLAQKVPDDFMILKHLGQALHGKGEHERALKTMQQAFNVATKRQDKQRSSALLHEWKKNKHSKR